MRKRFSDIVLLCMIFCLLLTGCNAANTGDGSSHVELHSTAASMENTEIEQHLEGEAMSATYQTQEIWVQNSNMNIYGIAYIPDKGEKVPLVIFSHELGNDHTSGERYAEILAEAGYAAYVFDFCGGTVGGNKSDGSNREMSVLTEASDLEAVLEVSKSWDFVDPDRIVLLGGSMGGLVTTVVGSGHQDEIAGMILMYPALSAKADSGTERYKTEEEIPEDVSLFGGWIHVGKNYVTDLWKVDFDQLLSSYKGHMLLLHGDKDSTVPISWSENVKEIIPDCEFHVIKNGGHEFFGQPFEDAMSYILPYLEGQMNNVNKENGENETMLQMKIGDTAVAVDWEDNESVDALMRLCQETPLTIRMSMYGGFEQVGPIGQSLPRDDSQTTTQAGDIVLYSGNQIVVFYGSNSWAYTRLGHIRDKSAEEMAELLSNGDVTITIGKR
ncbi:MAG: alpha/beta hydrolase [Lachnospiraceae bacterium]|nr:alpha/beta hydrolase [Lachnospiraceae bacterium]